MTLHLTSTQVSAACPLCQQLSDRVHSCYERILRDLNWAECAITLVLTVRKLFCDNLDCQRRIFSERIPQLVVPWARRTNQSRYDPALFNAPAFTLHRITQTGGRG